MGDAVGLCDRVMHTIVRCSQLIARLHAAVRRSHDRMQQQLGDRTQQPGKRTIAQSSQANARVHEAASRVLCNAVAHCCSGATIHLVIEKFHDEIEKQQYYTVR